MSVTPRLVQVYFESKCYCGMPLKLEYLESFKPLRKSPTMHDKFGARCKCGREYTMFCTQIEQGEKA